MSKNWDITLKSLLILAVLSNTCLVYAQQAIDSDQLPQPIAKEIRQQVLELLAMDCGMDEGRTNFTAALEKLPVDVSPIFIKLLHEGVPEEILDSVRQTAQANYQKRQTWLHSKDAEIFDKQSIERMSKVSFDDYLASELRKLNIRYQENAILGLMQVGKRNAISVINNAAKRQPELSILGEKAINSISQRVNIK